MNRPSASWLIALTLLLADRPGFAADPNSAADFTLNTHVIAPTPPRFGTNLREPAQYNNFTGDPGFEPVTIKRQHVATGGGADYIENAPSASSSGTWHYQTMADGFFDGANVRVYRPTGNTGPLQLVREATITNYITNGWRRLTTRPVSVSQFTDTTAVPGVNYEYQVRAVNTTPVVSVNHSTNEAVVTATALAGTATTTTPFFANTFFRRNDVPPAVPTGVTATPLAGGVALDWNDNPEADIAGYYIYRRSVGGAQNRIVLDSSGPPVQAGDIYFMEMTRDNAPVAFMHDRMTSTLNDSWRLLGGPNWPYGMPGGIERDATTVCPENGGRTSIRLTNPGSHEVSIRQARFSAPQFYAGFYPNLTPGAVYRVDVWLKQSGVPNGSVRFALTQHYSSVQHTWSVGSEWQKFTHTFTAPALPTTGTIAEIMLAFNGLGTVWADNFLVYEDADSNPATHPAYALNEDAAQALNDFQPSYVRIWTGVDTDYWGVTLEDWTNPEPMIQLHWDANNGRRTPDDPYKLPMALNICRDSGADPWLIVGSFFTENEWQDLIEYLAAPYDPLVDTPATKPYAFKRYSQGQHEPWTDVFPNIILEYGNELWNGSFQWNFGLGNVAGQFSEHFFQQAKASPYYAAVASKLKFTVTGWILGTDPVNGYGHAAARVAPSAEYSDLAFYIGGWEAGIAVGGPIVSDPGFQDYMLYSPTYLRNYINLNAAARDANNAAGFPYKLSVYEAGPGYANPSPGQPYEIVSETYGKSLASAVATLDTLLYNSLRGIDPQCYFSFGPGYNWSSHSIHATGYNPHINWLALQMRNRHVTGSMTGVATHSVPTIDVATRTNTSGGVVAPAVPNTPLIAVYPFRDGADWRVFVLSRKLTGDTEVTLRLPFTSISDGNLYKITGDPRTSNTTALNVTETQDALPAFAQNHTFTMPAGSIYLLEYLGTTIAIAANPTASISRAVGQADPTTTPAAQFAIEFSEPVNGFDINDLQIGGTALTGSTPSVTLVQGSPFFGTNYLVTISNFVQSGTITLNFAAAAANAVDDNAPTLAPLLVDGSVSFAYPAPQDILFASDSFNLTPAQNPHILQNVNTGTGWSQGWQVQNYNAETYVDGYKLATASPMIYSSLHTFGNYAMGGRGYEMTSRALNVASFQHVAAVGSNPAAIGQSGTSLWMSVLLRKESNDNAPVRFDLANINGAGEFERIDVGVGYYGTSSHISSQRYWTLAVLRDGSNPAAPVMDFVRSGAAVVIGETALLVVKMTFGNTDQFDMYVNPTGLGGDAPATPNATFTTTGTQDIRFRTARFRAGLGYGYTNDGTNNGLNKGSLDEVRFGDTFAAVTPAAGSNADLANLVPSAGTLSPAFASATSSYSASVPHATTSMTVTPAAADVDATVTINGVIVASGTASAAIDLAVGENTITTVVTAENGTTIRSYTLTVTRAASPNADLADLTLSSGTLSPVFNSDSLAYTAGVGHGITAIVVTPTVAQTGATVTVDGAPVASGTGSSAIPLVVGENTISVMVTAPDSVSTQTYSLIVTRAMMAVAGQVSFAAVTYRLNQDAEVAQLIVERSGGTLAFDVAIHTNDGTASVVPPFAAALAGTDYTDLAGAATTISFAANESSKIVNVPLFTRAGVNIPNRRFTAALSAPSGGATPGLITTATVEILADDGIDPTLKVTDPAVNAKVIGEELTYVVRGIAGDAKGIARVMVSLNGGDAVEADLAGATKPTSIPFSRLITPKHGLNTLVVTAYDLHGNDTFVERTFTFNRRYSFTLALNVPTDLSATPDAAGQVTLTATPSSAASRLVPSAADSNPRSSAIVSGTPIKLTAKAKPGYVFSRWLGLPEGAVELGAVATFTMPFADVDEAVAEFIATPFAASADEANSFFGLIHPVDPAPSSNATEGYLNGTLTASGAFTGKLLIDGVAQVINAVFYGDGSAIFKVGAAKQKALDFGGHSLGLSFEGNHIRATVTKDDEVSEGTAARLFYSSANRLTAPLLNAGTKSFSTLSFPSKAQDPEAAISSYPQGAGFATLSISSLGVVSFSGTLADGTAITGSSGLVAGHACPIFVQLITPGASPSSKGGSFSGVLTFDTTLADSDVTGTDLLWFRPAAAKATVLLYNSGWPNGIRVDAVGALYQATTKVEAGLGLSIPDAVNPNAQLLLTDGKLTEPVTKNNFNISGNAVMKIAPADTSLTLTLVPTKGSFSGTFTPNWPLPASARPAFKGILIQKGASKGGYGFFISNAKGDTAPESGGVTLGSRE